jgi:hypothetical protein
MRVVTSLMIILIVALSAPQLARAQAANSCK